MAEHLKPILSVQNLDIGYASKKGDLLISENLNFSVHSGEMVAVVGANGIGKSTLLRSLIGIQNPLRGNVFLNGHSLQNLSNFERATHISIVLTEAPATKNMSVREMISLGRQPHTNWLGALTAKDKTAIENALHLTDTSALASKKCFELSDGQMQRVAIARAIAQDTPLIILDEPTSHLDLYHRIYVLKLLKKLASETGKAVLFSTHEIDLAIQLADKILIMSKDAVHFNSPQQLIDNGYFDTLFPTEIITFNRETGQFGVRQ